MTFILTNIFKKNLLIFLNKFNYLKKVCKYSKRQKKKKHKYILLTVENIN